MGEGAWSAGAYQLDGDSLLGWVRELNSRSENFKYVDFNQFTSAVRYRASACEPSFIPVNNFTEVVEGIEILAGGLREYALLIP